MNQLETNLVLWAVCSILLIELLVVICICRCFFNRIKPKRFYVKKEEYEYMQGYPDAQAKYQSTILRPPHADELALIGTIRTQNPTITFDNGVDNFGFYRDEIDDDDEHIPTASSNPSPPIIPPPSDWIELRPTVPNAVIATEYLPPTQYEIHSYPTNNYYYSHQSPTILPRVNIIDYQTVPPDYDNNNDDDDDGISLTNTNENYIDEFDHFHLQSFRRPNIKQSQIQRTDTATEAFGDNYSTLLPKSILKSGTSTTPIPPSSPAQMPLALDIPLQMYSTKGYDYPSTSPQMSVKINTDESIPMDYAISAIETMIPQNSIFPSALSSSTSSLSPSPPVRTAPPTYRMRFASFSQLNDVEWEVPSEFQTVVYDLTDDNQQYRGAILYNSSQNFNLNNNNNNNDLKSSHRKRSQSAGLEQKPHVSRVFIPWESDINMMPTFHSSRTIEQNDCTQQQAFEY